MGDRKLNRKDIQEIDTLLQSFPATALLPLDTILQRLIHPPWGKRSHVLMQGYIEGALSRLKMEMMRVTSGDCRMHGAQSFVYSGIAKAWLCQACVEEGFYREDIVNELTPKINMMKEEKKKQG